jgi:predicted MFS family arabinose efflux permease
VRESLRVLLDNRDFRRLFAATVVSLCGDWFSFVALTDLVTELTGHPGAAAYISAAIVLPIFAVSPLAGKAADRFDRKRLLIISDLVRVPVALSLCLAAAWGNLWIAGGAVLLLGVASSFHDPASTAATPNLVDAKDLVAAQAAMGAIWGSMLFVGAGLGGIVAEALGRNVAFVIDAASFAISALLLAGIRRPTQEPRVAGAEHDTSIREALRYARRDPVVLRLMMAKVGVSSANGTVGLLPDFARTKFSGTNIAVGVILAVRGIGAMLGPIFASASAGSEPSRRAITAICGVSTLTYALVYALLPVAPWLPLACLLVVFAHLGGGAQWALSTYGLQIATPDRLRGRVLSIDYGIATLAIGISSIVAGVLADLFGIAVSCWVLATIAAVYGTGWLVWCRGMLRSGPDV